MTVDGPREPRTKSRMFPGVFGPLGFLQQHWAAAATASGAAAAAAAAGVDPAAYLPHWEYVLRSEGLASGGGGGAGGGGGGGESPFKVPPHLVGGLIKPGPVDTPLSSTILGEWLSNCFEPFRNVQKISLLECELCDTILDFQRQAVAF